MPKWLSISSVKNDAGILTEYVGVFSDITELQEVHEKLKHQATHDVLTGLPKRSLLNDRLEQAISHADRYQRLLTVVFMDLDYFKSINDTPGHQAGDDWLKVIAERMAHCVRSLDSVVRLGGDEFVAWPYFVDLGIVSINMPKLADIQEAARAEVYLLVQGGPVHG